MSISGKITLLLTSLLIIATGCGTTTQRLATEQLLISDAVDQAVSDIDFSYLKDQSVFLDITYLKSVRGTGYANTDYIVSSIREQLAAAGCRVQDVRADADIVVEPRVGAMGTDGHEVTYGIPQTGQLTNAAAAIGSGIPAIPVLPEISFGRSDKHSGIVKIMLFAYDRESKVAVWQSGLKKSESNCTNTWVMGAGPFQRGTIHEGFRFAGRDLRGEPRSRTGKVLAQIRGDNSEESEVVTDNDIDVDQERVADESSGENGETSVR